jgi:hypothetical protein
MNIISLLQLDKVVGTPEREASASLAAAPLPSFTACALSSSLLTAYSSILSFSSLAFHSASCTIRDAGNHHSVSQSLSKFLSTLLSEEDQPEYEGRSQLHGGRDCSTSTIWDLFSTRRCCASAKRRLSHAREVSGLLAACHIDVRQEGAGRALWQAAENAPSSPMRTYDIGGRRRGYTCRTGYREETSRTLYTHT